MEMTNAELQPLREMQLLTMRDRCDIERKTTIQEGLDEIETWVVLSSSVPCRIAEEQGTSEREITQGGRMVSTGDHIVRLPYGIDIHESDRIKVLSLPRPRTFEVSRVIEHSFATSTTVICTEAR